MISIFRCTYSIRVACSRCHSYKQNQFFKESRMLDRMIKKSMNRKSRENVPPKKLKEELLMSAYSNEGHNRKTTALNKFYMEPLMELIQVGPNSNELSELGIEFSKVKITRCRSSINIYWICNKEGVSEELIAKALDDTKKELQSQIGLMRSMRTSPYITFVKDLKLERVKHVEKLFEVADFGENFQPTTPKTDMKTASGKELELQKENNSKMREDVLGVDHGKIKEKIMQDIKRFQAINIKKNEVEEIRGYDPRAKLAKFDMKLFASFYKRKLYLDSKLRRREYNDSFYVSDVPYDPEQQTDKYWQMFKFQDEFMENLDKEGQGDNDCCDDYFERDDDVKEDDAREEEEGKGEEFVIEKTKD